MSEQRSTFPIRYSRLSRFFFAPILLGERHADVSLTDAEPRVRMGWALRAEIPRSRSGAPPAIATYSGRSGSTSWTFGSRTWLVNGSRTGIVFLGLDPPARGRTGPFPITIGSASSMRTRSSASSPL